MHPRRNYLNDASSSSSCQQSNHENEESGKLSEVKRGKVDHYNGDEVAFCDCNEPCQIATTWTLSNLGRRFHGCKNYGIFFFILSINVRGIFLAI